MYNKKDPKETFLNSDIKYWLYTKELAIYLAKAGYKVDESRLQDEYRREAN